MTLSVLHDIVGHLKPSGSPYDAVPPRFVKEVFPTVGPSVLAVVNSSLSSGVVPENFKHAVVQCGEWGGAESRGNGARPVE